MNFASPFIRLAIARRTATLRTIAFAAALLASIFASCVPAYAQAAPPSETLFVWHAYRGAEQLALETLIAQYAAANGVDIEVLAIPFGAYATKLESAIPHGHGPDVYVDAHERLGTLVRDGLVAPLDPSELQPTEFAAAARAAMTRDGQAYGLPLATKCTALIVNAALLPNDPPSFADLLQAPLPAGVYPFAYESKSAYMHAAWVHGFGGSLLTPSGEFGFRGAAAEQSLQLVLNWTAAKRIPEDASATLVSQLFRDGRAAAVISGPWLFADLAPSFPVRVLPLPAVARGGPTPLPFLTVEAAFLSPLGARKRSAHSLIRYLATAPAALQTRRTVGHQIIAALAGEAASPPPSAVEHGFQAAAASALPMPSDPIMRAVWAPTEQAIAQVLRGAAKPAEATQAAAARFADFTKAPPAPPSPLPVVLTLGLLALLGAFKLVHNARTRDVRAELAASLPAYRYVAHSALAVAGLIVLPLLAGAASSFYAGSKLHPTYVGFGNYAQILSARGGALLGSGSFYLTLLVTLLWTVVNVALHLGLGVLLGVVLARESMRLRPLYRTLLILPWAVPSYVTALAWKGMFHRQFGAINAILGALGAEPVAWFSKFSTAFAANVATNVWLGFPFMMVVTLGALTSISKDVLEAAEVDGATRWQRFRYVTLPLLRPVLMPSVALGAVWTFNMFNVVFLVSGGEPDGSTDILVSDAYRWAFTRDAQVGYAAAYAMLIFLLLFGASSLGGVRARIAKYRTRIPSKLAPASTGAESESP